MYAGAVMLPDLLHGEEARVWDYAAYYQGDKNVIHEKSPKAAEWACRLD